MGDNEDQPTEDQRAEEQDQQEPEQRNPGGQARPDRDDREYHDGV